MRNIGMLEEKWRKYKYKQWIPYIFLLFVALSILIYFLLTVESNETKITDFEIINSKMHLTQEAINAQMPLAIHGNLNAIEPEIVYDRIAPMICIKKPIISFNIQNKEANETIEINDSVVSVEEESKIMPEQVAFQEKNEVCLSLPSDNTLETPRKPKKIKFDTVDNGNALSDIMRRFNQGKDPNDSLFLSNSFYEAGEYSKSLFWAIETNKITEDMEDAWILMAKSKVKLGDKQEAVRILRAYGAKKMSNEAIELARQIESNEWN